MIQLVGLFRVLVGLFRVFVSLFRGFSLLLLYHENAIKPLILLRNRRFCPLHRQLFAVALSPPQNGLFSGVGSLLFRGV